MELVFMVALGLLEDNVTIVVFVHINGIFRISGVSFAQKSNGKQMTERLIEFYMNDEESILLLKSD